MWLILSAIPNFSTAAAESPPPITEYVSSASANACPTAFVPSANGVISNTPIGPFHTTSLEFLITSA
ncbi:Uncharacterised protein [Streptococcus pneumoniae]|nr:Uncharacterised protein [Streptococcus pneumoniae]